jgi:hypothetical protein
MLFTPYTAFAFNEGISLQVSAIIDTALTEKGEEHLQNAVRSVEKDLKIRIIERETNINSIKYLEMGYPSKPMRLKAKTAAVGIIAGLIPINQKLSKASEQEIIKFSEIIQKGLQEGVFKSSVVERDGFVVVLDSDGNQIWKLKSKVLATDKLVEVVADAKSGLPITGDLDLAFITLGPISKRNTLSPSKILNQPMTGIESEFEITVREKINTRYHQEIYEGSLTRRKIVNDLVNHGPESRNPIPRPPDYPFVDTQGTVIVEGPQEDPHRNFRLYLKKLHSENQYFELPEHWLNVIQEASL